MKKWKVQTYLLVRRQKENQYDCRALRRSETVCAVRVQRRADGISRMRIAGPDDMFLGCEFDFDETIMPGRHRDILDRSSGHLGEKRADLYLVDIYGSYRYRIADGEDIAVTETDRQGSAVFFKNGRKIAAIETCSERSAGVPGTAPAGVLTGGQEGALTGGQEGALTGGPGIAPASGVGSVSAGGRLDRIRGAFCRFRLAGLLIREKRSPAAQKNGMRLKVYETVSDLELALLTAFPLLQFGIIKFP